MTCTWRRAWLTNCASCRRCARSSQLDSRAAGIARVLFADEIANAAAPDDPRRWQRRSATSRPFRRHHSGSEAVLSLCVGRRVEAAWRPAQSRQPLRCTTGAFRWSSSGQASRLDSTCESFTPADIAPTLAHLCGVTLANPDGDVWWRLWRAMNDGQECRSSASDSGWRRTVEMDSVVAFRLGQSSPRSSRCLALGGESTNDGTHYLAFDRCGA